MEEEEEEEDVIPRENKHKAELEERQRRTKEGWGSRHLKGSCTQDRGSIIQRVLHGTQAVSDGILDLSQGVVGGALYEYGTGGRVLHILHKSVLVLTQNMLIHLASIPTGHVNNVSDLRFWKVVF